jgi:hypothetical protein
MNCVESLQLPRLQLPRLQHELCGKSTAPKATAAKATAAKATAAKATAAKATAAKATAEYAVDISSLGHVSLQKRNEHLGCRQIHIDTPHKTQTNIELVIPEERLFLVYIVI